MSLGRAEYLLSRRLPLTTNHMCRNKRQWAAIGVATAGALATLNGYRPLSNSGTSSLLSFASGLVTTDLPLQSLAAETGLLTLLARSTPPRANRIVGLLWGASCLGRFGLKQAGRAAETALTEALDVGLGSSRRLATDNLWAQPASHRRTVKQPGLVRMMRVYRDYVHDADIPYGPYGRANQLDIWRRPDLDRAGRAPVLLQIPGGAWATGNKRGQAHPLMSHLTELGWICVAINYRLSPRNTWPDQIVDVKRAIAWVKSHIASYGGDPDFVAVTGGSAGGHLSALAALTADDAGLQPGFEDADTTVQAAIPFYGVYDFTRTDSALHPIMVPFLERLVVKQRRRDAPGVYAAASPIAHIGPDGPPFFVLHGRNDSFIPVEQARSFVHRLRAVSRQPVAYAELPFAQHAFDIFGSARAGHAAEAVGQFLAEIHTHRSAYREARPCGS